MKEIISTLLYEPLYNALMFFVWLVPGHGVGWAIIILTIIIRLILLPSTNKALKKQVHMRSLQPQIEAIKEKYKDKKEEQAKALMDFYREHKVYSLGSCLPMLVQLPVLFVLYYVFRVGLDKSRFDLLYSFMPHPDTLNTYFFGINLATPEPWILPILAGILLYIQLRQTQGLTGGGKKAQKGQQEDISQMMSKQMTIFMPLMTVFVARSLPAALGIYWVVTTLFGIVQQWWLFRQMGLDNTGAAADNKIEKVESKPKQEAKKNWNIPRIGLGRKKDVVVTVRRKGE